MKLPRRKFLHVAAGAAALPVVSRLAWAQAYPSRPVRIFSVAVGICPPVMMCIPTQIAINKRVPAAAKKYQFERLIDRGVRYAHIRGLLSHRLIIFRVRPANVLVCRF
jgi:hypothetical protein